MNIGGFLRRHSVPIVLLAGVSGLIVLIIYPFYASVAEHRGRSNCQSQLKAIALACLQYQGDYDGKFPPLSGGNSRGWTQIIQSRDSSLKFSCPSGYESSFSPTSDYFFNARLATHKQNSVLDPALTISFGDGVDNCSTNSHYWELPNDGKNPNSPLQRHLWGPNYAFVDGHVKSFLAHSVQERIKNMRYQSP